MKHISVCIPTYEMNGRGAEFLRHSFDILGRQTFKDFDVVVSDHSADDAIERLCHEYASRLDVHYFRNEEKRGSSSANANNAIRRATGALIKVLFQDDFLYHDRALEDIAAAFDLNADAWLVTACVHTKDGVDLFREFHPRYSDKLPFGRNTISSPSVLTIRNDHPLLFDENLVWWMDNEYYRRLHDAYGSPKILDSVNVVNRMGDHQVTNTIATDALRDKEYLYMLKKYRHPVSAAALFAAHKAKRALRRALKKP